MNNILLLASQSISRRLLLVKAQIPFVLLDQDANEAECDWGLPLPQLVESIAKHKMAQIIMPQGIEGQHLFVLTADTLTQDKKGTMLGKPSNKQHAYTMLNTIRQGAQVGTAFCLDKKVYRFDRWQIEERVIEYVQAECVFVVPDWAVDYYLENSLAMKASGAITIEGFGAQFLKSINGSYSAIMGLPLYEVRKALEKLNFF